MEGKLIVLEGTEGRESPPSSPCCAGAWRRRAGPFTASFFPSIQSPLPLWCGCIWGEFGSSPLM